MLKYEPFEIVFDKIDLEIFTKLIKLQISQENRLLSVGRWVKWLIFPTNIGISSRTYQKRRLDINLHTIIHIKN